ncbi:gasdermin-D-like [Trichosurus vulpecula]|uniref:gasdermin-D-like n=1 Tax=Trichosurus vulpecula TaxID=9337 RepID=UPI00186AD4E0|nr:gasdermin-D-like [Trichosurus vulpecula]
MASAFEWATKTVVEELSRNGELVPVDSLNSSTRFSPYSLLRKKMKSSLFWRSQYVCLNLTLKDILDPSSPVPVETQDGTFLFIIEMNGQVSANVKVTDPVEEEIFGKISESKKTIFQFKTLTVSPTTWDCLQKERKLKTPEPSVFQQLREKGENLYVVTEAVKTQKEAIVKRSRNREGFGKITIAGLSCIEAQGQGGLNTVKTVTVPEGSILAFQVVKLIIRDHWSVLLLPDKNRKTFAPKDFEKLQAEVVKEQRPLTKLDRKFQQFLLQTLLGLLQSEQDLLDLEDTLEQSLYTGEPPKMMEGKTDHILSKLQDESGQLVEELAGAFLYLLGALNALSDVQHLHLIKLLREKEEILSREVKLVKKILKENFNQTKERPFSLPSKLLSFIQGQDENLTLTCGLLEECGLWLSGDEPQFTWNPSALQSLCALYGSLVMLQALTEAGRPRPLFPYLFRTSSPCVSPMPSGLGDSPISHHRFTTFVHWAFPCCCTQKEPPL